MEINKQKLLDWLDEKDRWIGNDYYSLKREINAGTFDSPSTQVLTGDILVLSDGVEVELKKDANEVISELREANKLLEAERDELKERLDTQRAATKLRQNWVDGLETKVAQAEKERDELKAVRESCVCILPSELQELEKERDIAVKALEMIDNVLYPNFARMVERMQEIAQIALLEIRRNTDAPKDTNGLSELDGC